MVPCNHHRVTGRRCLAGLVSILLFSLVLLAGCGGKDAGQKSGESVVLARVGDTDITAEMYKTGLAKMEERDLPRDDDGQPIDTATEAGKKAFLKVLINKELMRQEATKLGYAMDPQAVGARASLIAYHAGLALWDDVVGDPANTISEEELQAFYEKMGTTRTCQFVICNFLDDAEKARAFAQTGADWEEVAKKFHDGSPAPDGKYQIKVPYGQYSSSFEDVVFDTPVGGVTEPVLTSYGYWVMRVLDENVGNKPGLEEAKAQILDITRNRKLGRARNEFKEQMHKDHKLFIDEDVLWICYQGIPEGGLMDPATNQPRDKATLEPLNVPLKDMDRLFYSYMLNDELQEQTLGDYKGHFDKMSVFQRPKKSDMLGGLHESIIQELDRGMINEESVKRGYTEKPEVLAKVNEKVEEIMVTKLYADLVKYDEKVTSDQLDDFYEVNKADFMAPEIRSGRLVICLNEAEAVKAKADAEQNKPWRRILNDYGTDPDNKARGGKLESVSAKSSGPVKDMFFSLEVNQVSDPFLIDNGRYGVVVLESITPAHQLDKIEVAEQIGQRIKNSRKEEVFQGLLAKWATELGVKEYPENLAGLPSLDDLHVVEVPKNLVPRN